MLFVTVTAQDSVCVIPLVKSEALCFCKHFCEQLYFNADQYFTLPLSLMDPLPRMDIFTPVSSCNRFIEFPRGPSSFPTKLNCGGEKKGKSETSSMLRDGDEYPETWFIYVQTIVSEAAPLSVLGCKRNPIYLKKRLTIIDACWPLVIYYQYNLLVQSPFIMWEKAVM